MTAYIEYHARQCAATLPFRHKWRSATKLITLTPTISLDSTPAHFSIQRNGRAGDLRLVGKHGIGHRGMRWRGWCREMREADLQQPYHSLRVQCTLTVTLFTMLSRTFIFPSPANNVSPASQHKHKSNAGGPSASRALVAGASLACNRNRGGHRYRLHLFPGLPVPLYNGIAS